jgi:hypothetical protein
MPSVEVTTRNSKINGVLRITVMVWTAPAPASGSE